MSLKKWLTSFKQVFKDCQTSIEKCLFPIESLENDEFLQVKVNLEKNSRKILLIEQELKYIRTQIEIIRALKTKNKNNIYPKNPHKCPICVGTGTVSTSGIVPFDNAIPQSEKFGISFCLTCKGKGVVWD
jgi:hypothetical protein